MKRVYTLEVSGDPEYEGKITELRLILSLLGRPMSFNGKTFPDVKFHKDTIFVSLFHGTYPNVFKLVRNC